MVLECGPNPESSLFANTKCYISLDVDNRGHAGTSSRSSREEKGDFISSAPLTGNAAMKPNLTKGWVRLLVAVSVLWVLVVAGIIFAEFLARNPDDQFQDRGVPPEFYFWKWSLDLLSPRTFDPNLLRIVAVLFGPLPIFWVAGWLIVWVKDGFQSTAVVGTTATTPIVLGTKWLKFWNYFSLPVGGVLCIFLVFAFPMPAYGFLVLSFWHFYLAYGLHRRRFWAWQWNWVMIVATWIGGSIPYQFGSMLDFAAKFAIAFLLFAAIWMLPNYVYWMKRRVLFS